MIRSNGQLSFLLISCQEHLMQMTVSSSLKKHLPCLTAGTPRSAALPAACGPPLALLRWFFFISLTFRCWSVVRTVLEPLPFDLYTPYLRDLILSHSLEYHLQAYNFQMCFCSVDFYPPLYILGVPKSIHMTCIHILCYQYTRSDS